MLYKSLNKPLAGAVALTAAIALSACDEKQAEAEPAAENQTEVVQAGDAKAGMATSVDVVSKSTVKAINLETREVTLENEVGETVTIVAGEDIQRLDEIKVGDVVVAEYHQVVTLSLHEQPDAEPSASQATEVVRTAEGETPAIATIDQTVIIGTVESIDIESQTFELKGPKGNVATYKAEKPENLAKAKVGDAVVLTVTRMLAYGIEPHAEKAELVAE